MQCRNKENLHKLVRQLFKDKDTIFYRKEFKEKFKSTNAALLFSQMLRWWCSKKQKKFYKFKAPCKLATYKIGDSFCEELAFTEDEFVMALSKIAKKITTGSKRNLLKKEAYILYYTTSQRTTYYEVIEENVLPFLKDILGKNDNLLNRNTPLSEVGGEIPESKVTGERPVTLFTKELYIHKDITYNTKDKEQEERKDKSFLPSHSLPFDPSNFQFEGTHHSGREKVEKKVLEDSAELTNPRDDAKIMTMEKAPFSSAFTQERKSLSEISSALSQKLKEMDFSVYDTKPLTARKLNELLNKIYSSANYPDQIFRAIDVVTRKAMERLLRSLRQHENMTDRQIAEFVYKVILEWGTLKRHPRFATKESRAKVRNNVPSFWDIYHLHRELVFVMNDKENPKVKSSIKVVNLDSFRSNHG